MLAQASIPAAATPRSRDLAADVASAIAAIERNLTSTKYEHRARIDTQKGVYDWDCSIMAAWILRRAAPRARAAIAADKPLARDFYAAIARAGTAQPRRGWLRLRGPSQILPGDVFAWLKPEMFRDRKNTGHVGFAVSKPWPHPKFPSVWLMRIADATRELHGADSRPVGGEGGFGTATIAFIFDASDGPVAYGWYGEDQDPSTFVPTRIVFGRAFR
jgi:hypothetical protein